MAIRGVRKGGSGRVGVEEGTCRVWPHLVFSRRRVVHELVAVVIKQQLDLEQRAGAGGAKGTAATGGSGSISIGNAVLLPQDVVIGAAARCVIVVVIVVTGTLGRRQHLAHRLEEHRL